MQVIKKIFLSAFLLTSVLLFSSCDNANNPFNPIGDARLRLINSTARYDVNLVRVDSDTVSTNFPYTASIPYRNLTPAHHTVLARGTSIGGSSSTELGLDFTSNKSYTWFIHDNTFGSSGINITPKEDDNTTPAAGKFRMRVANLSPATGAISIRIASTTTKLFEGVSNGTVSAYAEHNSGTHVLEVRDSANGLLYYSASVDLAERRVYDLVVSGLNNATSPIIFTVYASN